MKKSDLFVPPSSGQSSSPLQPIMAFNNTLIDSKEYLVEGAKLICLHGEEVTELQIPQSHNYTSGGRVKANCKDCIACENIKYFGQCEKNKETHLCEGFMELEEKWENTVLPIGEAETVDGEPAISMTSILVCKKGGIIIPVTSGQGYEKGVDIESFQRRFANVVNWVKGRNMMCHVFGGDPINLNTGNFIYEKEDLSISGVMPITFKRFYNAMDGRTDSSLGEGWNHNYEVRIERKKEKNQVLILLEDGREIPYIERINRSYEPLMGDKEKLVDWGKGYEYQASSDLTYFFDENGQMVHQEDNNGNTLSFAYNDKGRLYKVWDAEGSELKYIYNEENHLICVTDHTGRKVEVNYQYGKLCVFTNVLGHTTSYTYNEDGKLQGIKTPQGVEGLKNEYDSVGRIVRQTMADGGVVELCYDDENNRSYIKEQNGSMTIHENDKKFRNIKTIYEDGEEIFDYNEKNQRILYIDKNGNKTRYAYDDKGNMTQIIDALARKTTMTYDGNNRLINVKLPDGGRIKNEYDRKGNLLKTVNQLEDKVEVQYNKRGIPEAILQPDGSSIQFEINEAGNVTRITDAVGNTTEYGYDNLNRVTTTKDGNGNITSYQYNEKDGVKKVINAEGEECAYTYDESGKVLSVTNFDKTVIKTEYNVSGRPCKVTDQCGNETQLEYDLMGNISKQIAPNGGVIQFQFNRLNKLEQITNPLGGTISYEYDRNGNKIKVTSESGEVVRFEYDALNRNTAIEEANGAKTILEYNLQGLVSKITDPLGGETRIDYDAAGQKIKETDALGGETAYTYNQLGQIQSITDAAGRNTAYEYEKGGLLKGVFYPDGRRENYWYDKNRNITQIENQEGYRISYQYDCLNQIVSIHSNHGQNKSYTYDAVGNITSMTDANGNRTTYTYSPSGNLTSVTDALNNRAEYEYDCMGELLTVKQYGTVDGKGTEFEEAEKLNQQQCNLIASYKRNLLGKVEAVTNALGLVETYCYDKAGNVIQKTDRDGYKTSFAYGPIGEIEQIHYGDGKSVKLSYDPLKQLVEMEDWLGTTRFQTDPLGRVTSVIDGKGREVTYELGIMGERKGITYPDGKKIQYNYDENIRLKELIDGENGVAYLYDENSRLKEKEFSHGMSTQYSYNEAGNLSELVHRDYRGIMDRYQYHYDAMGNRTQIEKHRRGLEEESGNYQYAYDALNRLTKVEKDGNPLRNYGYDSFGNRIFKKDGEGETAYTYNVLNQLVEEKGKGGIKTFLYDKRGNLTRVEENGTQKQGYEFGALNRLTKAVNVKGKIAEYQYNGLGQRVGKQIDSIEKIEYILDLTQGYNNLLQKEEKGGKQSYVWDSNLVSATEGWGELYYFQDDLGSPIRLLRRNQELGEVYGYDEFGNDLYGNQRELQPFGYTGYQKDSVSDTYFAQAREYSGEEGRFVSKDAAYFIDPMILVTFNQYSYVMNNPMNYIDPFGHDPEEPDFFYMDWSAYAQEGNIYGYLVDGVGNSTNGLYTYLYLAARNAPRPSNIGSGTWARIVANDLDDITRFSLGTSKILDYAGYAGLALDVGTGVYENFQSGASIQKTTADAFVDVTISGGTMLGSACVASAVGAAIGSPIPYSRKSYRRCGRIWSRAGCIWDNGWD